MRNARSYAQIVLKNINQLNAEVHTGASTDLSRRREQSDWLLCHLLKELVPVLPEEIRGIVKEAVTTREHLWSSEYFNAFYAAKEAA